MTGTEKKEDRPVGAVPGSVVKSAYEGLPPLPWRVDETMRDGYGAISETTDVEPPSYIFRNCSDADADAIVKIINAVPALLEELDRLRPR